MSVTPSKKEAPYLAICTHGVPDTRSHTAVFQKDREALHMKNYHTRCFQPCLILLASLSYTWRRDLITYILLFRSEREHVWSFSFTGQETQVVLPFCSPPSSGVKTFQVSRHFSFLYQPSEFFACVFY